MFRGVSAQQDVRFGDAHKKLVAKLDFPASFDEKVPDLSNVKEAIIKKWAEERIVALMVRTTVCMYIWLVVGCVFLYVYYYYYYY
jgi:hypothetical protein